MALLETEILDSELLAVVDALGERGYGLSSRHSAFLIFLLFAMQLLHLLLEILVGYAVAH